MKNGACHSWDFLFVNIPDMYYVCIYIYVFYIYTTIFMHTLCELRSDEPNDSFTSHLERNRVQLLYDNITTWDFYVVYMQHTWLARCRGTMNLGWNVDGVVLMQVAE